MKRPRVQGQRRYGVRFEYGMIDDGKDNDMVKANEGEKKSPKIREEKQPPPTTRWWECLFPGGGSRSSSAALIAGGPPHCRFLRFSPFKNL